MGRNPRAVLPDDPLFTSPLIAKENLCWDNYDTSSPLTMRKTRPAKRGDIARFRKTGDSEVKRGLIVHAGAYVLPFRQEWVSFYNVLPAKRNGEWASLWVRIYDGDLERGYAP